MKLLAFLIILFSMPDTLSGQTDTSSLSTEIDLSKMVTKKDGYLQKSRAQKTTAFIFLGLGTASIITGAMMMGSAKNNAPFPIPPTDEKTYEGGSLILLGMLVDLCSIPLFIASSNNKEKAMSVSLKNEPIPFGMTAHLKQQSFPALSLHWKF